MHFLCCKQPYPLPSCVALDIFTPKHADIGDVDNTRALYERVLTEDKNRKSTKLWEHYLAFEFEMGDLQAALRLEKRAREALGEAPGVPAGGGSSARNIQLLLLRYKFNDIFPCPSGQRDYLEFLMGRGPPPPGFEKQQKNSKNHSTAAAEPEKDQTNRCAQCWLPPTCVYGLFCMHANKLAVHVHYGEG